MKRITLTEFKKLTPEQLKESSCLEITVNCEPICFVVIGSEGEMKERIRGLSGLIDSGRGK
jgi:hypothetical protein